MDEVWKVSPNNKEQQRLPCIVNNDGFRSSLVNCNCPIWYLLCIVVQIFYNFSMLEAFVQGQKNLQLRLLENLLQISVCVCACVNL